MTKARKRRQYVQSRRYEQRCLMLAGHDPTGWSTTTFHPLLCSVTVRGQALHMDVPWVEVGGFWRGFHATQA